MIEFRLEANRNTYAAFANEVSSTRLDFHDFRYERDGYVYHDTYVGGEQFGGEEAVWKNGKALYAMNCFGRVLSRNFSCNFLKEALRAADKSLPYRSPVYFLVQYCIWKAVYSARGGTDMVIKGMDFPG